MWTGRDGISLIVSLKTADCGVKLFLSFFYFLVSLWRARGLDLLEAVHAAGGRQQQASIGWIFPPNVQCFSLLMSAKTKKKWKRKTTTRISNSSEPEKEKKKFFYFHNITRSWLAAGWWQMIEYIGTREEEKKGKSVPDVWETKRSATGTGLNIVVEKGERETKWGKDRVFGNSPAICWHSTL